jgi:polyhydroxyalkanoate synthesis regulator phasin
MINSLSTVSNLIIDETVSAVKKTVDSLVNDNKISFSQGRTIFDNIKNSMFDKSSELENSITDLIRKIYQKMDIATPEELETLKRRVTLLEKLTR